VSERIGWQCHGCRHFDWTHVESDRCSAFPRGIPDEIWLGEFDHSEPHPGDHGVVREPFEGEAERGGRLDSRRAVWDRGVILVARHADDPIGRLALDLSRGMLPDPRAVRRAWTRSDDAIAMGLLLIASGRSQDLVVALQLANEQLGAEGCDFLDDKGWLAASLGIAGLGLTSPAEALAYLAGPFRNDYLRARTWHTFVRLLRRLAPPASLPQAETRLPGSEPEVLRFVALRLPAGEIALYEPWVPVGDGRALEAELARELAPGHRLFGKKLHALARRVDCDDVFFANADSFAVVHLTWRRAREPDPRWPATEVYRSLADFAARGVIAAYEDYSGERWHGTEPATGAIDLFDEPPLDPDGFLEFRSELSLAEMLERLAQSPIQWSRREGTWQGEHLVGRGAQFRIGIVETDAGRYAVTISPAPAYLPDPDSTPLAQHVDRVLEAIGAR
jgi:hypothetical protein